MARNTKIQLKSFAKINISLDVLGKTDNGFHEVEMVMQQISLCDDVTVYWDEDAASYDAADGNSISIHLATNSRLLPTDERNLAYKAALLMIENYGAKRAGRIRIDIKKRIPVAAGLAGGSGNGAAVLHALNMLWNLALPLDELCKLGARLGSDVPFCVMGQAAANDTLAQIFAGEPAACHCALASGTGTTLTPIAGLKSDLVLSKPPVSVSTAEAYKGIDSIDIPRRPDNRALIAALASEDLDGVRANMINVLENFTLKRYPVVVYTKNKMQELCGADNVLMSGSGPTIFGLCDSIRQAQRICREMLRENRESFHARATY